MKWTLEDLSRLSIVHSDIHYPYDSFYCEFEHFSVSIHRIGAKTKGYFERLKWPHPTDSVCLRLCDVYVTDFRILKVVL